MKISQWSGGDRKNILLASAAYELLFIKKFFDFTNRKGVKRMKKITVRKVETLKTTAAAYGCSGCPWLCM